MKKLLMTLAAVASLGFVLSCSDEVLEVNLNKDSETIKESFTRSGKIEGTYEETLYDVRYVQPTKTVYKNPTSGNVVDKDEVNDDTFKKESVDGIDVWVRPVVRTTSFTARYSTITWDKAYAQFASKLENDTTYKDYYVKSNADGQQYTITMGEIEYGVPTLMFNNKKMTKNYSYNTQCFDADNLKAEFANADLLSKGDVEILSDPYSYNPYSYNLYKVGNTYLDDNFKEVTFDGNLEDGNIQNLSLVLKEKEISVTNSDKVIVKPAAWTNTYKLTITKFERYNK